MRTFYTLIGFVLFGIQTVVGQVNLTSCGYQLSMTAVGNQVYASLQPENANSNTILTDVKWYDDAGVLIGQGNPYECYMSEGLHSMVVKFNVLTAYRKPLCSGEVSNDLIVTDIIDQCTSVWLPNNPDLNCGTEYAPVCGCNNITYNNYCEAYKNGITDWKSGACNEQPSPAVCGEPAFEAIIVGGTPQTGIQVLFNNLSSGVYTNSYLEFGDHYPPLESTNWTSILHTYPPGNYLAELTTWKIGQPGCTASAAHLISTDSYSMGNASLPDAEYVRPGDTNGDKEANMYDLINIGLGYAENGVPRPDANLGFLPQLSPNWPLATNSGVNYKHLDCNGDGVVNEFDVQAIELNYTEIDTFTLPVTGNSPVLKVDITGVGDTIFIDQWNPQALEINADILVADFNQPVFGLYALAFTLNAPDYIAHNPNVLYDASFFGTPNYVLQHAHENYPTNHLDLGFTQKSGKGVNGYGRLAQIKYKADFIIIIDVIDRTESQAIPLTIPIEGLKAVDSLGQILKMSAPVTQDTIWIKKAPVATSSHEQSLNQSIIVSPNPVQAGESIGIYHGQQQVISVDVTNALGQVIQTQQPTQGRTQHIQTNDWQPGIYTIRINTSQGIAKKKIVVTND